MLNTTYAYNGMLVAPHHLASQAGLRVLKEGGNAVEAMIAAASTISVVYPHMNNLGGDNFWLIHTPDNPVRAIDACGGAAGLASADYYRDQGLTAIPDRGPQAALTMAGVVSGWESAYSYSQQQLGGKLPLSRLFEDAIYYAREGVAVAETLAANAQAKLDQLKDVPGFAETYISDGKPVQLGQRLFQKKIADTFEQLARKGLNDFYLGELADAMASDLESVGSPIRLDDFRKHSALQPEPLSLEVSGHKLYNMPPPTQGLASLILLGVYDRLGEHAVDSFEFVHALVEATKCAFRVRDRYVTDPEWMSVNPDDFLQEAVLSEMAATVNKDKAAPWPDASVGGDTVWLGAMDSHGRAVSFIQSVYWEFGSGVVLPSTGITWQNRGISFSLDDDHHNTLAPGRRPFHTIQPALAQLKDGRVMSYGTMGGEGQPQTQAMLFARHVLHGQALQETVTAPRWLLGRTWGSESTSLRIESRFSNSLIDQLIRAGHVVEAVGPFEEFMGHAGALVMHPDGLIEAGADPRSDGAAVGF